MIIIYKEFGSQGFAQQGEKMKKPVVLRIAVAPQEDIRSRKLAAYRLKNAASVDEAKKELRRKHVVRVCKLPLDDDGLVEDQMATTFEALLALNKLSNGSVVRFLMHLFGSGFNEGIKYAKSQTGATTKEEL